MHPTTEVRGLVNTLDTLKWDDGVEGYTEMAIVGGDEHTRTREPEDIIREIKAKIEIILNCSEVPEWRYSDTKEALLSQLDKLENDDVDSEEEMDEKIDKCKHLILDIRDVLAEGRRVPRYSHVIEAREEGGPWKKVARPRWEEGTVETEELEWADKVRVVAREDIVRGDLIEDGEVIGPVSADPLIQMDGDLCVRDIDIVEKTEP